MAEIGKSARQSGGIGVMASLKACPGTGRGSALRLCLAVVPAVLAVLSLPAAAFGNGALTDATVPGVSAPVGAAQDSIPEQAPQAAAQALSEKPVSPPKPPPLPPRDSTSAPVVEAPTPVNAPNPAPPPAVKPPAGDGRPIDSVTKTVNQTVQKVDAVTADPVPTTTNVVQDVQKDASNLAGLIDDGGGPPAPPDLVRTTTNVVQDVQKDVLNLAGLIGGGGPGADVPELILGSPARPVDGAAGQTASVRESPQSPLTAPSFEQLPPGAHSVGSVPGGGGSQLALGPGPGSAPMAWDGAISDTAQGAGAIPVGARGYPAGRNSSGGRSSVSSRWLAGVHAGIVSPALERSGGNSPPTPTIPPLPKLPAMGSGAGSISLLFGLASALAVMLALEARRSGFSRRLALEGARPVGFARLLERPG